MADILDAGHAAMHRSYEPSEADLNTALDITEGIFSAIYVHTEKARKMASCLPARPLKNLRRVNPKATEEPKGAEYSAGAGAPPRILRSSGVDLRVDLGTRTSIS
jgi:hypothetical protein